MSTESQMDALVKWIKDDIDHMDHSALCKLYKFYRREIASMVPQGRGIYDDEIPIEDDELKLIIELVHRSTRTIDEDLNPASKSHVLWHRKAIECHHRLVAKLEHYDHARFKQKIREKDEEEKCAECCMEVSTVQIKNGTKFCKGCMEDLIHHDDIALNYEDFKEIE